MPRNKTRGTSLWGLELAGEVPGAGSSVAEARAGGGEGAGQSNEGKG